MLEPDDHRASFDRVSAAFSTEIDRHDPQDAITWASWPTVAALTAHLGGIHLWAGEIVRRGGRVDRASLPPAPTNPDRAWYDSCREKLRETLAASNPDAACWVIGDRADGTARFWMRRMVFETTKHLIDLRAAGGDRWIVAPELSAAEYADGIDELFEVFLPRSRATLDPLPAPLHLDATDIDRRWTLTPDWQVHAGEAGDEGTVISASAGELALFVWERGDPLSRSDRYALAGESAVVRAYAASPVHPG